MTLAIFLGTFVVILACLAFANLKSDRKRQLRTPGSLFQEPSVDMPTSSATLSVTPERALDIALEAVENVGSGKVEIVDDSIVVGWIGSVWTNIPSLAQYQLLVRISMRPEPGMTQFTCQARPRSSMQFFGDKRSRELTGRLLSEVESLA
jgi:hypothetical protein